MLKGQGYDHVAALTAELVGLVERSRRIAQLEEQLPGLTAGSAGRVLAERERSHLAFVQDHMVQLLADVTRGEVEDGDGGLSDLATAAERLAPADCPTVLKLLADVTGGLSLSLRTLRHTAPDRAEKLVAELSRLQTALARTGPPAADKPVVRLPGE
ncbi:MAG: hypothetical protein HY815_14330 [Candidatus Riflebacteria bacterium]|nr:hypothetical protein [Candidatus Riflebacteria bacterium]